MAIQLSQIEISDPRLLTDSHIQRHSDSTFDDKLQFELARRGLSFAPISFFDFLFTSPLELTPAAEKSYPSAPEYLQEVILAEENSRQSNSQSEARPATSPQIFESFSPGRFNRQWLQKVLSDTGWLMPNLEAQPLLSQAFNSGKLQPKFDLQSLIDQIIEQVKLVKGKGRTELSLALKPQELGEILLTLTSRSGVVSIQIQAPPEAKKLIDNKREELERALKKAGIRIESIEIREVKRDV